MSCRVLRWVADGYFGAAAEVEVCAEAGAEYLVSPLGGGLPGAFPLEPRGGVSCATLRLPPGRYELGASATECVVEPPSALFHAPSPYYVGVFGDEVEVRAYAAEPPEVCGRSYCARGEELISIGRRALYRAIVDGPPYAIECCGLRIEVDEVRPFRRPKWAPLVMYEVMPDRVKKRLDCRDLRRDLCGGTLDDLSDLLDYAAQLADAIYLHPIYRAMSYHRYDVLDHMSVDELLGGLEAYERLRGRARGKGLGVVLDVVLHHVGLKSKLFKERRDLFRVKDEEAAELALRIAETLPRSFWPLFLKGDPPYETFMKVWAMPKLDYRKREVLEYAESVLAFWSGKADGFRFDVAHGVPPEVWARLLGPYAETHYLLAEHTGDPAAYLGAFHGFTAYELYNALLDFLALDKIDAAQFAARVKRYLARVGPNQLRYMYTFVENHDTDRFCSLAGKRRAVLAYAFIYSMPGVPAVYAGGEACAKGLAADHTNRTPLDELRPDPELLAALEVLYRLRRRYPEIAEGPVREVFGEGDRLLLRNASITLRLDRRAEKAEVKAPDGYYSL